MPELDDVLWRAENGRTDSLAGTAMTPDAAATLTGRIRARRARRQTLQVAAVVPLIAALTIGGWQLTSRDRVPVAGSPSPSPTAEPSPSPTAETSGESAVLLPDESGLPTRYSMPVGVLEAAGSGWVLATYVPVSTQEAGPVLVQTVVMLASPDGTAYEVLRLGSQPTSGPRLTWTQYAVVDWRPGEVTALLAATPAELEAGQMTVDPSPQYPQYQELNLKTGHLSTALPEYSGLKFEVRRGESRWWSDAHNGDVLVEDSSGLRVVAPDVWSSVDVSPDGSLVLAGAAVVDVASGAELGGFEDRMTDGYCHPVTWWTTQSILALCTRESDAAGGGSYADLDPTLVVFDRAALAAGKGTVLRPLDNDPVPLSGGNAWVADGKVVVQAANISAGDTMLGDVCADHLWLLDTESFSLPPTGDRRLKLDTFEARTAGGHLVVATGTGCGVYPTPTVISQVDLATGTATTVLGLPAAVPEGATWLQGITGWVLGD